MTNEEKDLLIQDEVFWTQRASAAGLGFTAYMRSITSVDWTRIKAEGIIAKASQQVYEAYHPPPKQQQQRAAGRGRRR